MAKKKGKKAAGAEQAQQDPEITSSKELGTEATASMEAPQEVEDTNQDAPVPGEPSPVAIEEVPDESTIQAKSEEASAQTPLVEPAVSSQAVEESTVTTAAQDVIASEPSTSAQPLQSTESTIESSDASSATKDLPPTPAAIAQEISVPEPSTESRPADVALPAFDEEQRSPPAAPIVAPAAPAPAAPTTPAALPSPDRISSPASDSKRRSVVEAGATWKALGTTTRSNGETSSTRSYRTASSTTEAEIQIDNRERDRLRAARFEEAIQDPPPPAAPSVPPSPLTRFVQPFPDTRPTPRIPDHSHRYYPEAVGQHKPPPSYYNQPHHGIHGGQPTPPYHSSHSFSPMDDPYRHDSYRHDSAGSHSSRQRDFMHGSLPPPHNPYLLENGDEGSKIIGQLSSTIPEIQKLMARYYETQGKLGEREERIRDAEAKQEEILRQQDQKLRDQYEFINSLRRDLDSARSLHAADSTKFRLELGSFQDQQRALQDRIRDAEVKGQDLEKAKAQSEAQIQALEKEKASLDRAIPEERERLMKEFEEWKMKAKEEADAQQLAIAAALLDKEKEHETELEKRMEELRSEHETGLEKRKEELKSEHETVTKQLEADFAQTKTELDAQVTVLRGELDAAIKREAELATEHDALKRSTEEQQNKLSSEWEAEKMAMKKEWEEEHSKTRKGWHDERELLLSQHAEHKTELERKLGEEGASRKAEVEKLQQGWDEDKKKMDELVAELRRISDTLGSEKDRLQKLLTASAVTTDLKSKGDAFYKDAFKTLCRLIVQLADEHFNSPPTALPDDVQALILAALPGFLADTPPSRHLRSSYIAHVVSTILTKRIFTPFLFSLGSSYDNAEALLSTMSMHLQSKSAKREAIWRQQTLIAAFQCEGAKQQINVTAGTVVDEILNTLKPFSATANEADTLNAIRRIVKHAAETWRLARLERDLIAVSMPPVVENDNGASDEFWRDFGLDQGIQDISPCGMVKTEDHRSLVLRVFPVVHRAPTPEDMRITEEEQDDQGCVYSHGLALYEDSKCILERREELQKPLDLESIVPERAASRAPSTASKALEATSKEAAPTPELSSEVEKMSVADDKAQETESSSTSRTTSAKLKSTTPQPVANQVSDRTSADTVSLKSTKSTPSRRTLTKTISEATSRLADPFKTPNPSQMAESIMTSAPSTATNPFTTPDSTESLTTLSTQATKADGPPSESTYEYAQPLPYSRNPPITSTTSSRRPSTHRSISATYAAQPSPLLPPTKSSSKPRDSTREAPREPASKSTKQSSTATSRPIPIPQPSTSSIQSLQSVQIRASPNSRGSPPHLSRSASSGKNGRYRIDSQHAAVKGLYEGYDS